MSSQGNKFPTTPDGHYFVVRGRLWRCSNPGLDAEKRHRLTSELMAARRSVKAAKADKLKLAQARQCVQKAKEGLGERGTVWWRDGGPQVDRQLAKNTPYAQWYAALQAESQK